MFPPFPEVFLLMSTFMASAYRACDHAHDRAYVCAYDHVHDRAYVCALFHAYDRACSRAYDLPNHRACVRAYDHPNDRGYICALLHACADVLPPHRACVPQGHGCILLCARAVRETPHQSGGHHHHDLCLLQ